MLFILQRKIIFFIALPGLAGYTERIDILTALCLQDCGGRPSFVLFFKNILQRVATKKGLLHEN